ncbi:testis-expressed protein 48 [Ochotona curzoniae]|uniref:testis-expressed protein 48 n=1 Tax=Ochotona curzoniae TaxID=130825 RepID=UPI001B347BA1|nr:testis-expressed protein 48 [Ochotona curzoniae]
MASNKSLASKICCLCCQDCQEPQAMDDSRVPSQTQARQPHTSNVQLPKDELNKQNFKHANSNSCLPLGQPLVRPENTSSSSSEFEDVNEYAPQRGFYKRNLNRYSQERWPFQPCLIGRP